MKLCGCGLKDGFYRRIPNSATGNKRAQKKALGTLDSQSEDDVSEITMSLMKCTISMSTKILFIIKLYRPLH